jgi:hypothetical protein
MNRFKLFALVLALCVLGFVAGDVRADTYPGSCPANTTQWCAFAGDGGPWICKCVPNVQKSPSK